MKLRKIFDEEAIRPKPGLTAEQMPAEVEDPFTGEMKPYKGGKVKEEKASKKDKVKDAVSQSEQMKLYNALSRQLPRLVNKIYPTHKDSVDDLVTEAFISFVQPKTSDEDIQKLIAEDEAKGISHSMNWYKYEQTKYPKEKAKIEQFDAEKIGGGSDAFDKFVAILVRNFLINKVRTDKELNVSKNDEGKNVYNRVARTESLDRGTLNSEGEMYNPVMSAVDEEYSSEQHYDTSVDDLIEAFKKYPYQKRRAAIQKVKMALEGDELSGKERSLYSKFLSRVAPVKEKGGYARTNAKVQGGSADDFPFGIEPVITYNNKHEKMLRFVFPSRQEAEEAAEKYADEMAEKGYELNKVIGSKLSYKLKED